MSGYLGLAQQKMELSVIFTHIQQGVAQLSAECLKVPDRIRIRGDNSQHLTATQTGQGFLGLENRQGTTESRRVQLRINYSHKCE